MEEKKSSTVNMIEKLMQMLPSLSETEAEAARFQIERLRDANPFLSGAEAKPATILECWESRGTSRMEILASVLKKEKDLLRGYNIIMQAESSTAIKERIEYTQRKIYFVQSELTKIRRMADDAGVKCRVFESDKSILERRNDSAPENSKKRTGKAYLTFTNLNNKNPLYKNVAVHVYVEDVLFAKLTEADIANCKAMELQFNQAQKIDILLISDSDVVIGWLYFPIEDLVVAEDKGERAFYYSFSDTSTLSLSFGQCVLESHGLQRGNVDLITQRAFGHVMRLIDDKEYYYCGVCSNNSKVDPVYYRCDNCKFTCHLGCARKIFFLCVEYLRVREEEEEKNKVEEQINQIRIERLKMIVAAIDIREKPETGTETADRTQHPEKFDVETAGTDPADRPPTKKYSIEHSLNKTKILGMSWCSHCGERLSILALGLMCSACEHVYHIECRPMIFCSCGITDELRTELVAYHPAPKKKEDTSGITLDEFEMVSLIGRGTFGKVFLCRWKDQTVALKSIKKKTAIDKNCGEYMEIERRALEIAKASKNPYLLEILGSFQTSTHVFFATEFAAGGDLYFQTQSREIPPEEIQMILAQILLGVESLHSNNIIYRDLKLDNIYFTSNGRIKIGDFGLVSIGAQHGVAHTFCGTLAYVAPEVIKGKYTKVVDWWGLGVIAYELVMHKAPFHGETKSLLQAAIKSEVPEDLDQLNESTRSLIEGLLDKNPKTRLGAESSQQIKEHPYFAGINWSQLKTQPPPAQWTPSDKIEDNFDLLLTREPPAISPAAEVTEDQDVYFQNF
ncbi:hypothetical protein NEHOM01_0881 [Nematocida homosporus]|uniref:uncharacterized protein n=1 Tax=Nematocida homosporus TaxID=1912981 RepID=UPI00221FA061|nr:uncharacterized protein NEHOM01_0881 [Nematocida homosporus]KAI5185522.1 hypothetical protein NEHOM01_0881 [Nematocida homosporus]